jgi:hypothetical protein
VCLIARMNNMKAKVAILLIGLAACGGSVAIDSRDSGTPKDAGSHDSERFDTGQVRGDGSTRPEVGTSACQTQDQRYVLCSDGNWHNGALVFPPCPADAEIGHPCEAFDGGGASCVTCDNGTGDELSCVPGAGQSVWHYEPISCSQ